LAQSIRLITALHSLVVFMVIRRRLNTLRERLGQSYIHNRPGQRIKKIRSTKGEDEALN
jgi:hypothetical protein